MNWVPISCEKAKTTGMRLKEKRFGHVMMRAGETNGKSGPRLSECGHWQSGLCDRGVSMSN